MSSSPEAANENEFYKVLNDTVTNQLRLQVIVAKLVEDDSSDFPNDATSCHCRASDARRNAGAHDYAFRKVATPKAPSSPRPTIGRVFTQRET